MTVFMRLPFCLQSGSQQPFDERQQRGDQVCNCSKQQKDFNPSLQPGGFLILIFYPFSLPSFFGLWLRTWILWKLVNNLFCCFYLLLNKIDIHRILC